MISSLFKKMNFKEQSRIVVLNAPIEFKTSLSEMETVAEIMFQTENINHHTLLLAFVQNESEITSVAKDILDWVDEDLLIWFAYPKKSSKTYKSEINRDSGWQALGNIGLEGVRAIAIDEDWSALRFRHVKFIKSFTRNNKMILSKEGKERKLN